MFAPVTQGRAAARLPRVVVPETWIDVVRPIAGAAAGAAAAMAVIAAAALVVAAIATPIAPAPTAAPIPAPIPAPIELTVPVAPIAVPVATAASIAAPVATAAPTAAPVATPAPAPTAAPAPPAPAVAAEPYRSAGRLYSGLSVEPGTALVSPLAGRAEVRLYQLISGEIRTGANVASLPFYPYVLVRASDGRVLTLRPGAQGTATEVLVRDGDVVTPGTPLLRVTGSGASSWRAFYDGGITYQVVVSLVSAGGADQDAGALFAP